MNCRTQEILLHGALARRPAPLLLRAGPFTALFEPDSGWLRYLRLGDYEAVRAIYGAVRDRNWGTVPTRIENLRVDRQADRFRLEFEARCRQGDIRFSWTGTVEGQPDGTVTFDFQGRAESGFLRNRIGLCVLHPIDECAGHPCQVERVDGRIDNSVFPAGISPDQPFREVRALTYEPAPGAEVEIRFEGETFEVEDQRNWTDASFKAYGTPLDLPFPVLVEPGTTIGQRVQVRWRGPRRRIMPVVQGRGAQLSIATTPVLPVPPLGLATASHGMPLSTREQERLRALRLAHLRTEVRFDSDDWPARLAQAGRDAAQLGCVLHLALFLGEAAEAEWDALLRELPALPARVALVLVGNRHRLCAPPELTALAKKKLAGLPGPVLLAAGTPAHFAELNRNRLRPEETALPCYSISPQVHATDEATLVENLAAQPMTLETTRQFAPRTVVISPVTLRPRLNPAATDPSFPAQAAGEMLPPEVDLRQRSLFGAGWTLGSIARLAQAGNLHSLTYYETTGWRGVMETESGSSWPEPVPCLPGTVYPVYHLLADLAGWDRIHPTRSSHPLQTEGMTLVNSRNQRRILLANFLGEPQEVRIKTGTCQARVRYLDETNVETALREPESFRAEAGEPVTAVSGKLALPLRPYALACVDMV